MHNKVVVMAARSLRELGAVTVRFNFRGTGASAGLFDHGDGEVDDLRAVVRWVREQRPGTRLWLAGFSFGAYVSLRANDSVRPDALISIAPPAGRWDFAATVAATCSSVWNSMTRSTFSRTRTSALRCAIFGLYRLSTQMSSTPWAAAARCRPTDTSFEN